MKSLPKKLRILLFTAIGLFVYGILCRQLQIRFFWESETIGLLLLMVFGSIALLRHRKAKRLNGETATVEAIFSGILAIFVLSSICVGFFIPTMDAYTAAKRFLLTAHPDPGMIEEVYAVVPLPNLSVHSYGRLLPGGQREIVTFEFIVKGRHRFGDVDLIVKKTDSTDWTVTDYKFN